MNDQDIIAKNKLQTNGTLLVKSEEIKLNNITPADGQILKRQSGKWVNVADPALDPYTTFTFNEGVLTPAGAIRTYKGSTLVETLNLDAYYVNATELATILSGYATTGSIGTFIPIILPSASTVAGRLVGLTEGVDYPNGWVLTDDGNDLIVTHGLNRHTKDVVIWSENILESINRKEIGNAAYSGLYEPIGARFDSVVIESLATIPAKIIIYITFL